VDCESVWNNWNEWQQITSVVQQRIRTNICKDIDIDYMRLPNKQYVTDDCSKSVEQCEQQRMRQEIYNYQSYTPQQIPVLFPG